MTIVKGDKRKLCLNCGVAAYRQYCSNTCQQFHRHALWVSEWLAGAERGNPSGIIPAPIKRWLRETRGDKCELCGWCEVHPTTCNVPVEVDHIDGDHRNNRPENLRLLCPNCHSLTPNYRALNRGAGRAWRRTE